MFAGACIVVSVASACIVIPSSVVVIARSCVVVVEWEAGVEGFAEVVRERVVSPVSVRFHLFMRALVLISHLFTLSTPFLGTTGAHLLSVRVPQWQSFSFHA
jgi:hypothetical protein